MEVRGKRQLPMWMLKGGGHEGPGNKDDRLSLQDQQKKVRRIARESGGELNRQKANCLDEAPGSNIRCEKRKRATTSSLLDVKPSISSCRKAGVDRKKSSERKTVANPSTICIKPNHGKLKQGRTVSDETDGDVELTVDDLVIIAEEFVNSGGKGREQSPGANLASESEASRSSSTVSPNNELGRSCGAVGRSVQASSCTAATLNSGSSADMVEGPLDVPQTADAAKDMLDVFLGPLLRKPVEARKPEVTQDAKTVEDRCAVLHGNNILGDEEVRMVKRKSSLRDKVALYLD